MIASLLSLLTTLIILQFTPSSKLHPILLASKRMKQVCTSVPLILYRRPKNLISLLVQASISSPNQNKPGNYSFGQPYCKTCPIIVKINQFTSKTTGETFYINFSAFCKPSSVVYLISCSLCRLYHIRETEKPLHVRMNGCHSDIKSNNEENLFKSILTNQTLSRQSSSNGYLSHKMT